MQGGIGHELGLWCRHLDDEEVRALVVVVRGADLDVVVAIGFSGDQVEPSDRAQDVALRDAEWVVELGDAGGLELSVVLGHARGVGELGGVDEVREVHAGGMIEVGALGDARLDRPAGLPWLEGEDAGRKPEKAGDAGEGYYGPSAPSHPRALPSVAGRPYHRLSPSSYGTEAANERIGRKSSRTACQAFL